MKVIKRRVFLDDNQNEAEIRKQFNRAVHLAQRNGSAIAIGHPHPTTVRVLQQMLPNLPADITLVRPSQLLNEPQIDRPAPAPSTPRRRSRSRVIRSAAAVCQTPQPVAPVPATRALSVIADSIQQSALVKK